MKRSLCAALLALVTASAYGDVISVSQSPVGSISGQAITPASVTASSVVINGNGINCASIDNPTLMADCANHRVGIGTGTPSYKLQVVSNAAPTVPAVQVSSQNGTGMFNVMGNGVVSVASSTWVIPSSVTFFVDGTGNFTHRISAYGTVLGGYQSTDWNTNNIGTIGVPAGSRLDVLGSDGNAAGLRSNYIGIGGGGVYGNNKADIGGSAAIGANYGGFNTAPPNGLIVQGNVGVSTRTPQAIFEVGGGTQATKFMVSVSSQDATSMFNIQGNGIITAGSQPAAILTTSYGQTVGNNTVTPIYWGSAVSVNQGMWTVTPDSSTITIPAGGAGLYQLSCVIAWDTIGDGTLRLIYIYKNGSQIGVSGLTTTPGDVAISFIYPLVAGDAITCQVLNNSTAAGRKTNTGAGANVMSVVKVW